MKAWMFLIFLGMQEAAAVTHSMTYIVTAATGLHEFPEHNEVGLVDGQEFVHYDSKLMKVIPKTDWIEKNVGADYWERETQRNINTQETFKANIDIAMKRFNQTGGVHIVQWMYGCDWDKETGEVNVYEQFGYDGEDFISFDLKTETWVAPVQQADITKNKWNSNRALIAQKKNYLTQICPEWLKKYVSYGRSSLMRTERPSVSLLQKSSSSPVTCHATGFYPNRAEMVWKKDGVELHEGVNKGEILTNNDGTFQMSVDLDVSSVKPEDWHRYRCVFQLSGVNEDIVTKLDKAVTWTNEVDIGNGPTGNNLTIIIAVVAVVVVLSAVIGIVVYKMKTSKCSQPPMKDPAVKELLNPPPKF